MSNLADLKRSVTEMSDEELAALAIEIRSGRTDKTRLKPKAARTSKKKADNLLEAIKGLPPEELAKLLKGLPSND